MMLTVCISREDAPTPLLELSLCFNGHPTVVGWSEAEAWEDLLVNRFHYFGLWNGQSYWILHVWWVEVTGVLSLSLEPKDRVIAPKYW